MEAGQSLGEIRYYIQYVSQIFDHQINLCSTVSELEEVK